MKLKALLFAMLMTLGLVACEDNKQGDEPQPATDLFEITIGDVTERTAMVYINPKDDSMTMFFGLFETSEFKKYDSNDAFIADSISYLEQLAASYGMELTDLLAAELKSGDVEWGYSELDPGTSYTIYVYGLDADGTVTTDLYTEEFHTTAVTMSDCTFSIEPVEVNATSLSFKVIPSDETVGYYYDLIDQAQYEQYCGSNVDGIADLIQLIINDGVYNYGLSVYDAVSLMSSYGEVTSELYGDTSKANAPLVPNTSYFAFAVGLGVDGTIITDVEMIEIKTLAESSNTFNASVSEVTCDSAHVTIQAELVTEAFAFLVEKASFYQYEDGSWWSDDDIMQHMVVEHTSTYTSSAYYYGDYGYLAPNTDYVLLVCGYSNGTYTTDLTKVEFRTLEPTMRPDVNFVLRTSGISKTDITFGIIPSDYSLTYYFDILTEERYLELGGNNDALLKDIEEGIAYNSTALGLNKEDYLTQYLGRDEMSINTNGKLQPDTKYIFYVVGMYVDGSICTDFYTIEAKTNGDHMPFKVLFNRRAQDKGYYAYVYMPSDSSAFYFFITVNGVIYDIYDNNINGLDVSNYTEEQIHDLLLTTWKNTSEYNSRFIPDDVYDNSVDTLEIWGLVINDKGEEGAILHNIYEPGTQLV